MGKKLKDAASAAERKQWVELLKEFANQVEAWAASQNWPVARQEKLIEERAIGSYAADTVHVKTPQGILIAEPIAYSIVGRGEGRIDLYSFPTLHRVLLIRMKGKWVVYF